MDGFAIYAEGWSDQRIVDHVNAASAEADHVEIGQVNYRRKQIYGPLPPRKPTAETTDLERRMLALEERVSSLEARLL